MKQVEKSKDRQDVETAPTTYCSFCAWQTKCCMKINVISVYLCICVFVYLCVCVFVYLCICIFVYALLTHGNVIFDILELSSFQKYTTWWVFLALCHMLYLCICVFVYLCICIWVGKVVTRPIWPKKCQSAFFYFLI